MAKKTPAEREAEKAAAKKQRLEILAKLAKGEINADEAEKLLNARPDREWEVGKSPDQQKVTLRGPYARFPVTLYPAHIVRMADEGHWEAMVKLAREMLANPVQPPADNKEGEKKDETAQTEAA